LLKFHSFEVLVVGCSTLEVQQPKIDDLQTTRYSQQVLSRWELMQVII